MRQVGVVVAVAAAALPWLNKFANNLLLPCLSATPETAAAASLCNVSRRAFSTLDAIKVNVRAVSVTFAIVACDATPCPPPLQTLLDLPAPHSPLAAAHPLLLLLYLGLYLLLPQLLLLLLLLFLIFLRFLCVFFSCASSSGQQKKNQRVGRGRKNYIYYSNRCAKCWKVACALAPCLDIVLGRSPPAPAPTPTWAWSLTCSLLFPFVVLVVVTAAAAVDSRAKRHLISHNRILVVWPTFLVYLLYVSVPPRLPLT